MGMTPEEKHYWELSEVYLAWYQDLTKPIISTSLAMGVLVEMESDVAKHLKDKGFDKIVDGRLPDKSSYPDNVKKTINRIAILKKSVEFFAGIAESNFLIKQRLDIHYKENQKLQDENDELRKQVDVLTKTIEYEQ